MIRRSLIGLLAVAGTGIALPQVVSAVTTPDGAKASEVANIAGVAKDRHAGRVIPVTLVTGETVGVSATGSVVSVTRNGKRVLAAVQQGPAGVSVIPHGAERLLASGRVDPSLFNVTQLIAQGYDDRNEPRLPVIARYRHGNGAPQQGVRPQGARLQGARAVTIGPRLTGLKVPRSAGPALWKSVASGAVEHLWLDHRLTVAKPRPLPASPAKAATSAAGAGATESAAAAGAGAKAPTGKGVRVAVISSGVDATHPDLKGRVVASQNFSFGSGDIDGDGTAIASLIAGSGAASKGKHKGVAPGSAIIDAKVFNSGNAEDSSLLAGMDWAARTQKAKIAVLGLGRICRLDAPGDDAIEQAIADLTRTTGTLFVAPTGDFGNRGEPQSLCSPGTSSVALTAGGTSHGFNDEWSGAGPRRGDHLLKPEVSAESRATVARSSTARDAALGTGPYTDLQSTNMAVARVGAAVALLAERKPGWKAAQFKNALVSTAEPNADGSPFEQGAGAVDAARALRQTIASTPGTHSAYFPWTAKKAVSRRVTVTNNGKSKRTLKVSLTADPELSPAPPKGMFSTRTKKLVVKPGTSARITVVIDPAKAKPGDYVSRLTVSSGKDRLRAVLAAYVEPASGKLTINLTDANRRPVSARPSVVNLRTGEQTPVNVQSGTGSAVLPDGTYVVTTTYDHTRADSNWMIGAQVVTIRSTDQTITFDGSTAKRVQGVVEGQSTTERITHAAAWTSAAGDTVSVDAPGGADHPVWAMPSQHSALSFGVQSRLLSTSNPRQLAFEVAHVRTGGIPADPTTTQTLGQMAKVVNTLTNHGTATRGGFEADTAIPPNVWKSGMGVGVDFPSQLTMYVTGGFTWDFAVRAYEPGVGDPVRGQKQGLKLEAGKTYEENWDLPAG